MKCSGKTVAITGGAGGIGSLLVRRILEADGKVIIIDRANGTSMPGVEYIQGDLSTAEGVAHVAAVLTQHQPDILINLAGIQYFGLFDKQDPLHVARMFQVNLIAPTLLAQSVIPAMRQRGGGQIVNIGSVFGAIPFAYFVTYSSAKAGLKAFSEALRRELAGSGIVITHIAPRAVKTALNDQKVMALAARTKMQMDAPELVAERIMQAVEADAKDVVIGFPESLFTRINALSPRLVDGALVKNDRIAYEILSEV